MDLIRLAGKLADASEKLVDLGGCRCDTHTRQRHEVARLASSTKTMVKIEENILDYRFAEQMGEVEEGWGDYQNYLSGSRFAL